MAEREKVLLESFPLEFNFRCSLIAYVPIRFAIDWMLNVSKYFVQNYLQTLDKISVLIAN